MNIVYALGGQIENRGHFGMDTGLDSGQPSLSDGLIIYLNNNWLKPKLKNK